MHRCDIVLFRGHAFGDWLIRLGQSLRYGRRSGYFRFTHCGLVVDGHGGTIEATSRGVHRGALAGRSDYVVIRVDGSEEDRRHAIAFAESCVQAHQTYGWLTITGIALSLATNRRLTLGIDTTKICSGLVGEALTRLGVIWPSEPESLCPADIAAFYCV